MNEVTLTIATMGTRGDGLAMHEGRRIHIPLVLPGEEVRGTIQGDRLDVIDRLTNSPDRALPECRHFGTCGGCAVQHWVPEKVAAWKRERIALAVRREGLEAEIMPVVDAHGAGRRRVTLHIRRKGNGIQAGFMRQRSHDLVDLDSCPLLEPSLAKAPDVARRIGHVLRGATKPLDLQVTASAIGLDSDIRGAGPLAEPLRQKLIALAVELGLSRLTLHGERLIEIAPPFVTLDGAADMKAFLPPGSFLQATARAEQLLAERAIELLHGARHVADLFCGLGPFTLRLGRKMKVTGYDSDRGGIEALQRSIRANPGGKPMVAEARDLFRRPLFASELKAFDAVLLDPPRQGAAAQVEQIAKSGLTRVVYVSCDPESFARDAASLVKAGFRLGAIAPFDQFRHSPHVELVADFTR